MNLNNICVELRKFFRESLQGKVHMSNQFDPTFHWFYSTILILFQKWNYNFIIYYLWIFAIYESEILLITKQILKNQF